MRGIWEELVDLTFIPPNTNINEEIKAYVDALRRHEDEQKLFQFLNGVNECYSL